MNKEEAKFRAVLKETESIAQGGIEIAWCANANCCYHTQRGNAR